METWQQANKDPLSKYFEMGKPVVARFVSDEEGHYDMDGVSFGCGYVIVASDVNPWFSMQSHIVRHG